MSCTCFSVRLLIGLDAWVMITRPFQATGVKVSRAFCGLPSEGRALPARSAVPLLTASMPEAVLNGCSSTRPWPALVQAADTSLITALAVASSPRQIRLPVPCAGLLAACWVLANATVERQAPNRATDSRRTRRTDMIVGNPGVIENNGNETGGSPAGEAGWQPTWEPVGLWLAGLRIRLCGPYSCRFLVHRTTMDRQIVRNLSSHSRILASTTKARRAPRVFHRPEHKTSSTFMHLRHDRTRVVRRSTAPGRSTSAFCLPSVPGIRRRRQGQLIST